MELHFKEQFNRLLRRPKVVLLGVSCLLLLINAVYFGLSVMPAYKEHARIQDLRVSKELELEQLKHRQDPFHVSDAEVEELSRMVPTELIQADLIDTVTRFAGESRVWFSHYKRAGGNESEADPLQQQIDRLAGGQAAQTNSSAEETGASTPEQDAPSGDAGFGQTFQQTTYQVNVTGRLPALLTFFEKLTETERIITIEDWSMVRLLGTETGQTGMEAAGSALPAEFQEADDAYTLNLRLTFYAAPGRL